MLSENGKAVFAGLFAGAFFGLFWIPLRAIEEAGFGASWALFAIMVVPATFALPFAFWRRHDYRAGWRGLVGGVIAGVAFAFYSAAFLYTDVVRAVLLFYLLPIWGFLFGRLIFGEAVTWYRWLAIGLGFAGLYVIFAQDTGLPSPENRGDWFALLSGMIWALGSALILLDKVERPALHMVHFFATAGILCLLVALVSDPQSTAWPDVHVMSSVLVWLVPVALLCLLPAGYATVYAPTRLNPGVVGLLFMLEVVVALIAAALFAGETLGPREWIGLPLIMAAGLIEPYMMLKRA